MAFSVETVNRLLASGRNYASTIVGFIGGVGLMSASQSKGLTDAISEMINGLSMIVHGAVSAWGILIVAFPIIGGIMAKMASNSAKPSNQAVSLQAAVNDPKTIVPMEAKVALLDATAALKEVDKTKPIVVTDQKLADATEARNVVTK